MLEARAARESWPLNLDTIYFGGGTPTFLSHHHLERFLPELLEALAVDPSRLTEWTTEMNPMTFDESKLRLLSDAGVTRASLGVQAWDSETLNTLGRDHSPEQGRDSLDLLRVQAFPKISIDLMFSIPGQSLQAWKQTLETTIALAPDHISAYNLNYEEDTEFFDRLQRGVYRQSDDADVPFFEAAMAMLGNAGYEQYEISNYALPGAQSVHNRGYWEGNDYIGIGPSAFSTVARQRWQNVCSTEGYTKKIRQNGLAALPFEPIDDAAWRCERLALELRTARGVSFDTIGGDKAERVADLESQGLVSRSATRVMLTNQGKMLADSVAEYLL